ncbi:MAG: MotA/TolQ/ExbB proton channel family protein [Candidatus Pelagadaptatus aseana]
MELLKVHMLSAGPVIYPLLICSVLTLAIIAERLLVALLYRFGNADQGKELFKRGDLAGIKKASGLMAGLQLLNQHRDQSKALRDEIVSVWLQQQRRKLQAHTRWLTLLGAVAPLLGLLGTVLGIISMFQNVAHVTGPVTPALLADGMWEAMVTTALGMAIAIPALVASQVFSIWGDHRVEIMAQVLNECSLSLELEEFAQNDQNIIKPAVFQNQPEGQLA